ncbi:MAG: AEC family transporter [Clostridia bacterium]|nr:AEC family transporter [Clostridia bacterium]
MASNFLTVFIQVLTLFLFMAFGFVGGKRKIITPGGSKVVADIVLMFVTPCVIINSFRRPFNSGELKKLLLCFALILAIHAVSIAVAHLIFKGDDEKRKRVLRFATVFSNAGYMGLPLQEAVLGADGLFYGSIYVSVFNIVVWTYGILCMSGDRKLLSGKKVLFNPGILGTIIGFIIFIFSINIDGIIGDVVSGMSVLNTPLAMIVIGFYLSQSDIVKTFKDKSVYGVALLRLIVLPLVALFALWFMGIRGPMLVALTIGASAPTAAATSMFATKFDTDTNLSVNVVTFTTILSILTMPLIVALAQSL